MKPLCVETRSLVRVVRRRVHRPDGIVDVVRLVPNHIRIVELSGETIEPASNVWHYEGSVGEPIALAARLVVGRSGHALHGCPLTSGNIPLPESSRRRVPSDFRPTKHAATRCIRRVPPSGNRAALPPCWCWSLNRHARCLEDHGSVLAISPIRRSTACWTLLQAKRSEELRP